MKLSVLAGAALLSSTLSVPAAPLTYFGEDLNRSARIPLSDTPNADEARAAFFTNLSGVGTETFESASGSAPLSLDFPGTLTNLTATLNGGNGRITSVIPGTTQGTGRYAISGSNFWEVAAGGSGNFSIEFSSAVSAFGFYGIDIGDFGGQLELSLTNGSSSTVTVPNSIGRGGSTDGSVFYFGLIANDPADAFTGLSFLTSTGSGDVFAFDDLTIADAGQISGQIAVQAPSAVPLPPTGWVLIASLGGLGLMMRRQKS